MELNSQARTLNLAEDRARMTRTESLSEQNTYDRLWQIESSLTP